MTWQSKKDPKRLFPDIPYPQPVVRSMRLPALADAGSRKYGMDYGIVARDVALVVVEFLKVLTWPGVVVIVLWMFRPQISSILRRIRRAAVGDLSVDLSEEAGELSDKVGRLPDRLKKKKDEDSTTPASPPDFEPEMMDDDATAVLDSAKEQIRNSWAALANMTLKLHQTLFMGAGGSSTPYVRPRSVVHAVTDFHRNGMIDTSALETFRSAQRLKDELLENANSATFETYGQFLSTIGHLKTRVQSWISEGTRHGA